MIRKFVLTLAAAGAFGLPLAGPAQAVDTAVEGAPGGAPFRVTCEGGYVSGFEGRSGAFIDHVRVVCSTWDAGARRFRHRGPVQIQLGTSQGGGPTSARCPEGWAVARISFQNTWRGTEQNGFVHHIHFLCASATSADVVWRTFGPNGEVTPPSPPGFTAGKLLNRTSEMACPAFEFATGLHGRAGTHLDALGLSCGTVAGVGPAAPSAATPPPAQQPQAQPVAGKAVPCKSGFVWRLAGQSDFVCVTPASRERAANENRTAAGGVQPGGGAHGPNTCRSGRVWRSAFPGDVVCVSPSVFAAVQEENRLAPNRAAGGPDGPTLAATNAPQPQPQPQPVPQREASFSGNWITQTNRGPGLAMQLAQNGREVRGTYVTANGDRGRIVGRFGANVMQFNWEQASGFSGAGEFRLSPDGNSFTGSYRAKPHPSITDPRFLQGSWNGRRQ